jgi:hypothetical protein
MGQRGGIKIRSEALEENNRLQKEKDETEKTTTGRRIRYEE